MGTVERESALRGLVYSDPLSFKGSLHKAVKFGTGRRKAAFCAF